MSNLWVSNFCQHLVCEAAHIGDHRVGGGPVETKIYMADAEIAEGPQVVDDIGRFAGKQPAFAVIRTRRQGSAPACDAIGEGDL